MIIGGNQMDSLFLLTQNSGKILGPIAKVLGYLMNAIYVFMDKFLNIFEQIVMKSEDRKLCIFQNH